MRFSRFPQTLFYSFVFCLSFIFSVNAQITGTTDASFGTNGVADSTLRQTATFIDQIIQPDKKIVVIGTTNDLAIGSPVLNTVARFNENGTLDTTFSDNGYNDALNFTGTMSKLALQADGKIVIAGTSPAGHFAVLRLNTDGAPDSTFGTNGLVTTVFGNNSQATSVNITADGKIVLVGGVTSTDSDFGLIRYNSDGSLDTTFGTGGKVVTQLRGNDFANDAVIQPDGKIVAVGGSNDLLTSLVFSAVVRYNPDGSIDESFGANGVVYRDSATAKKVSLTSLDGSIVVAESRFIVKFKSNGVFETGFITAISSPNTVAVQPDGKILIGGVTSNLLNAFQKFNRNGSPDTNFGTNGTIQTNYLIKKISVASDKKIVVGGQRFTSALNITIGRINNRLFNPINMFDFDGDTKSDIAVHRPSARYWYGLNSSNNNFWQYQAGTPLEFKIPADFDGDGKTDKMNFLIGLWNGYGSLTNGSLWLNVFGYQLTDIPMAADYNGDGKADYCVFRPTTNEWRWYDPISTVSFGTAGDKPVIADFDGDFKADIAVFRPSVGDWYWLRSSDGQFGGVHFGISTDIPIPADYDGDGKTDIAVYRNGNWYWLNSSDGSFSGAAFGLATDIPVPTDYDGDGKADIGVYRPTEGVWYLYTSTGGFSAVRFGSNGDLPIPYAMVR